MKPMVIIDLDEVTGKLSVGGAVVGKRALRLDELSTEELQSIRRDVLAMDTFPEALRAQLVGQTDAQLGGDRP